MRRGVLSTGSLLLAVVLLLAVNILAATVFGGWRLDLTQNRLYTLSDGSRAVVGKLEEPITLNLFFSQKALRDVPQIQAYAARVRALLGEYVAQSGGKLQLKVIDPEPFSDAEDRAVQFGLRGLPVGGAGGESAYFGLAATNSTDGEEVIPFLSPASEDTLEYDLTRLVYKLGQGKRPVVAVMSSLPVNGSVAPMTQQQAPAWAVIEQLRELFEVRVLATFEKKIPDDVELLILIHPKDLSPATQFAIDQFALRKGRVLALLDPYSDVEAPPRDPIMPTMTLPKMPSDLGPLLGAWGVDMAPDKVIGDREAARMVSFREDAPPQEYLVWLDLQAPRFDRKDVVTARLSQMYMNTVGALVKKDGAGTEFTPLMTSSLKLDLPKTEAAPPSAARPRAAGATGALLRGTLAMPPSVQTARVSSRSSSRRPWFCTTTRQRSTRWRITLPNAPGTWAVGLHSSWFTRATRCRREPWSSNTAQEASPAARVARSSKGRRVFSYFSAAVTADGASVEALNRLRSMICAISAHWRACGGGAGGELSPAGTGSVRKAWLGGSKASS